jgi:hypothetical protein
MHWVYVLKNVYGDVTYVGYTSKEASLRLDQHNGLVAGGAAPTRKDRPWSIVLVVGPFPTKRMALAFEFAMQFSRLIPGANRTTILRRRGLLGLIPVFNEVRKRALVLPLNDDAITRQIQIMTSILTIEGAWPVYPEFGVRWARLGDANNARLFANMWSFDNGWIRPAILIVVVPEKYLDPRLVMGMPVDDDEEVITVDDAASDDGVLDLTDI